MTVKRIADLVLSLLALMLLLPVMLTVAVMVWWRLGYPVFFTQLRPGLNGKAFKMIKFRTMREFIDTAGHPLPDEQRLTRFGTWLRASSLDELPELWNVLRGDMSLVGPRPLLMEYLPLYSPRQARRHQTRPGITGWAQVNGRNAISWEERLEHDVWYVDHQSFVLDMRILFRTIGGLFQTGGISHAGHATMPRFTGSKQDET